MEQLTQVWSGMDMRRKLVVLAATAGMFLSVLFLAQMATKPRMALLYAGLDPSAAGEVVAALEARGAVVEVRGTAIYVPQPDRDALRLALAGEGLPQNGSEGYELLDSLTGFGTTAQMFDTAYWRAKEGELARTIRANRAIRAARVHISNPTNDPFRQGQVGAASVTVTTAGAPLSQAQATAITYLIASAVAGLDPEDVSVIDGARGLVPTGETGGNGGLGAADSRAEALRDSVTRLLEARVGAGKAVVEVAVDTVSEREEITERRFDPDTRVQISSDSEETTTRSNNSGAGSVTVASNLPEGNASGSARSSESSETRSREVANFEVSETQRAVLREPGALRRLSVAVLVDGVETSAEDGTVAWAPRPEAELEDLRQLVASAVGFDAARGDQITIRSMQFQPPPDPSQPVPVSVIERFGVDVMSLIQIGVLALVGLLLGLFVVRPILLAGPPEAPRQLALPGGSAPDADVSALPPLEGEITGPGDLDLPEFEAVADLGVDPAQRLKQLVATRQDETIEVLNQWMNDQEKTAG